MASTSFHHINADRRLGKLQRVGWMIANALNNSFPRCAVDPALTVRPFRLDAHDIDWSVTSEQASPSRQLCDLFWSTLPWAAIHAELGGLRLLDIGCGSGRYARLLNEWAGGRVDSYLGLDVAAHARWPEAQQAQPGVRFGVYDGTRLGGRIPDDTTVIVSQSAIEHFDHDLAVFSDIARFAAAAARPLLQIHLVPAASGLRLYPWHGVRQYTPRTLSKISRLFAGYTRAVLFELGGTASNRVHWRFVARRQFVGGSDARGTYAAAYAAATRAALTRDLNRDAPRSSPSFYALVLHSHPRGTIFTTDVTASTG